MMHGHEKSGDAIVAVKPTNKAERSAAEPVEQRAKTKGNAGQQSTHRAQYRVRVSGGACPNWGQGPLSRPPLARSAAHSIADEILRRSGRRNVPKADSAPAGYPVEPLVSYWINRQLFGDIFLLVGATTKAHPNNSEGKQSGKTQISAPAFIVGGSHAEQSCDSGDSCAGVADSGRIEQRRGHLSMVRPVQH